MSLEERTAIGIICDKETAISFYIGGLPITNSKNEENILMVNKQTSDVSITTFYEKLLSRKDMCLILIDFDISNRIKNIKMMDMNMYLPLVLNIPTKTTLESHKNKLDYIEILFADAKYK